jgi:hypothetical protein
MSLDNVRTGFTSNWFRTNVNVMQPKEIGFGRYTITHFYYSIPIG